MDTRGSERPSFAEHIESMSLLNPGVTSADKMYRSLSSVRRIVRVWARLVLMAFAIVKDSVVKRSKSSIRVDATYR